MLLKNRAQFYEDNIKKFIINKNDSILICGGGNLDKKVFENNGYKDVTISNLDVNLDQNAFHPYKWKFINAENIPFDDNSFDFVVVHASVHHASSPHRIITEMYRVSKKGILVIEARDSFILRAFVKLGLTEEYEYAAVQCSKNQKFGGVNNTCIPNYVYRWTERDVEKTISSYAPYHKHKIIYQYGSAFPGTLSLRKQFTLKIFLLNAFIPLYYLFTKIFSKQQNLFSFFIEKKNSKEVHFPWLHFDKKEDRLKFNKEWGNSKFK